MRLLRIYKMDIVELYEVEKGYVRIIFIFVWMKMGVF